MSKSLEARQCVTIRRLRDAVNKITSRRIIAEQWSRPGRQAYHHHHHHHHPRLPRGYCCCCCCSKNSRPRPLLLMADASARPAGEMWNFPQHTRTHTHIESSPCQLHPSSLRMTWPLVICAAVELDKPRHSVAVCAPQPTDARSSSIPTRLSSYLRSLPRDANVVGPASIGKCDSVGHCCAIGGSAARVDGHWHLATDRS